MKLQKTINKSATHLDVLHQSNSSCILLREGTPAVSSILQTHKVERGFGQIIDDRLKMWVNPTRLHPPLNVAAAVTGAELVQFILKPV